MRESIAGFAVRALGVAVAGTLIACSGGTGPADETVLFEDDFSSGTLAKWIVSGPGTTADDTFGNAAPSSRLFKAAGAMLAGTTIRSGVNFDPTGGLTLTADVADRSTTGDGQLLLFLNTSNGSNTCLAAANVHRTTVQYELRNGGVRPMVNSPVSPDAGWHTYSLVISSSGAMTWYRDGVVQLTSGAYAGCVAAINTLRLEASIGGLQADEFFFNLDNVRVSRP